MKKDQNESPRVSSNVKRKQAKEAPAGETAASKKLRCTDQPKRSSEEPPRPRFRDGSKSAKIIALLRRPTGATIKEMMKATKWQPHSVRGFLAGGVRKKMGLELTSFKRDDGARAYRVPAL